MPSYMLLQCVLEGCGGGKGRLGLEVTYGLGLHFLGGFGVMLVDAKLQGAVMHTCKDAGEARVG